MAPPTLLTLATNMAVRNINHIQDFADMPWEVARPILRKVENPHQLYKIELNSPQFVTQDEELWLAFIDRDFPDYRRTHTVQPPEDGKSWFSIYFVIREAENQKQKEQEDDLKKKLLSLNKVDKEVAFVDKILPTPLDRAKRARFLAHHQPNRSTAKTGKDMLAAFRRESAARSKNLAPPTQQKRAVNATQLTRQIERNGKQVRHAPPDMVKDAADRRTSDKRVNIIAPRKGGNQSPTVHTIDNAVRQSLGEREARLRAIKANKAPVRAASPPLSQPATQPPPAVHIPDHTPDALPVRAIHRQSPDLTGHEITLVPKESPPPPIIIQKRKAPVSLFMAKKKRIT